MFTTNTRLFAIAALLIASAVQAQTPEWQVDYPFSRTAGHPDYAQGTLRFDAHAEKGRLNGVQRAPGALRDPLTIGAEASVNGDIRIFGAHSNVLRIEAEATSRDAYRKAGWQPVPQVRLEPMLIGSITIMIPRISWVQEWVEETIPDHRVARLHFSTFGFTVVDEKRSNHISKSFDLFALPSGLDMSQTFWVGPVPVAVSAGVSLAGDVTGNLTVDPIRMQADASAPMSAYIDAYASAGLGGSILGLGLHAGVRANLELMRLTVTPSLTANLSGSTRGDLAITLRPLYLQLALYATIEYIFGEWTGELPIFSFSTPDLSLASARIF